MAKVDIKLGYSCNNECIHCVIADYRELVLSRGMPLDVPSADYRHEMEEAHLRGVEQIVFTGGEPTIRPDLGDLVAYAQELGFTIDMQTNGRKFADREFTASIASIAPINYCVALHAPDAQIHDAITRVEGSFCETVQGIKNLLSLKQKVGGKLVVSRANLPVLAQTADLFIELGVDRLSITFPHACGNARTAFEEIMPTYLEAREPIHQALERCIRGWLPADTEAMPFCHMAGYEEFVGELHYFGEQGVLLKQYGQDELIEWDVERLNIKRKFPQCKQCRFNPICEGPWMEYPQRRGDGEFIPIMGPVVRHPREILDGTFLLGLVPKPLLNLPLPMAPGY